MADEDLTLLAALLPEPEVPLGSLVLEILSPRLGDSADPGPGVGQGRKEGGIGQVHVVGGVDLAEQVPGLLDGQAGSLAV